MSTLIIVAALADAAVNENGFTTKTWEPVFEEPVYCLWVNQHGSEVYENMRLGLKDPATLTLRYSPKINERCRIWRAGEPQTEENAYEVVSIDNVREGRRFLEVRVRRVVKA